MTTIRADRIAGEPARWRRRPGQRGQAAVEMALLLPMLLILLFGIILSGFSFYAFIQVSNAAREGARAGSVYILTKTGSGLDLATTVQRAIYDSSVSPPSSALGFLVPTSPSFNVNSDVVTTLADGNPSDACPLDIANPCPGDRVEVTVTYRYWLPLLSDLVPMFPQPTVIVREVTMEVQ